MTFNEMPLICGLFEKHREDHTKILWEKSLFYAQFYKFNFLNIKKQTTNN